VIDRYGGELKIYDRAGSPNTARVRIVLATKGLEDKVDFVSIDLSGGAAKTRCLSCRESDRQITPLELDDGTMISQSTAITEYLDYLDGNLLLTGQTPREKGHHPQ
jgi:glutathione S-transferase